MYDNKFFEKIKFLDLGKQPIANGFLTEKQLKSRGKEFFFDLSVQLDTDTGLVSLSNFVELSKMFNENYPFHTSASPVMVKHFSSIAKRLNRMNPKKVMEIGSNDGAFLKNFSTKKAISVEPCKNFAEITSEMGYKTYPEFWTDDLANEIIKQHGKQDLIYAANCMCHIPDIQSAFNSISRTLSSDGVFVFEDPSLLYMFLRNSYDQIYDEHAHIFSLVALKNLLERAGMKIWKVEALENIHGGSCRIYAVNEKSNFVSYLSTLLSFEVRMGMGMLAMAPYHAFAENVKKSRESLTNLLKAVKQQGKKIISYGATSKSTTVFNYCGLGPETIDYITDTTPDKIGKFSPGTHIPIVKEEEGFDESVDFAFLGAWNYSDAILDKHPDFKGSWITHVPEVRII